MKVIDFGEVPVFEGVKADKAQALKVVEEAAELFGAWRLWDEGFDTDAEDALCDAMIDEAANVVQALANLLAGVGVKDMREMMDNCKERNEQRGSIYASNHELLELPQYARPQLEPCPFCGEIPGVGFDGFSGYTISCDNNNCAVECFTASFKSKGEAVEAWNRRAR